MQDSLDIAEVVRLTGLTSRALRFYETRGMLVPLRTYSGRRYYGPAELERLHRITSMQRAGLTLAQIRKLLQGHQVDLRAVVESQLEALEDRERAIASPRALLESTLSRIDQSEPVDVETFCALIKQEETTMSLEKWEEIQQRYMTRGQIQAVEEARNRLPPDFDWETHSAKWKDLDRRIVAALPMDPASPKAQAFLAEWNELIQPFIEIATPEMLEGVSKMHEDIEIWQGEVDNGFSAEAFRFHQAAHVAQEEMKAD